MLVEVERFNADNDANRRRRNFIREFITLLSKRYFACNSILFLFLFFRENKDTSFVCCIIRLIHSNRFFDWTRRREKPTFFLLAIKFRAYFCQKKNVI